MKTFFYAHLVDIEDISRELEILEISDDEKNELITILKSSIHHKVFDTILSELSEEHKPVFLERIQKNEHKKAWNMLRQVIKEPEEKIKKAIELLKDEFLEDVQKISKNIK